MLLQRSERKLMIEGRSTLSWLNDEPLAASLADSRLEWRYPSRFRHFPRLAIERSDSDEIFAQFGAGTPHLERLI
jgi:hypothetical protein